MMTCTTRKRRTWMLSVCAFLLFLLCPKNVFADDWDGDGIDDDLEMNLAARFLPTRHFTWGEGCPSPLPRPILFRARYMSSNGVVYTDYIGIHYVELYDDDCGALGHNGDNESFFVLLQYDGGDWVFRGLATTAHWGSSCELRGANYNNNVWISSGKHANYASPGDCSGDCFGANSCSDPGFTYNAALYNVGEPGYHLWPYVNDLGDVYGPWSGYTAWSGGSFQDAGVISDQLYFTRYLETYGTPDNYSCRVQCQSDYYQCYDNCDPIDLQCQVNCQNTNDACRNWCDMTYRWDP
jgi:hypothetical protein